MFRKINCKQKKFKKIPKEKDKLLVKINIFHIIKGGAKAKNFRGLRKTLENIVECRKFIQHEKDLKKRDLFLFWISRLVGAYNVHPPDARAIFFHNYFPM